MLSFGASAAQKGARKAAFSSSCRVVAAGLAVAPAAGTASRVAMKPTYLIFASRNSTCLRATGSYFFSTSFSVLVRAFFLVT